jgi:hypothetical protein
MTATRHRTARILSAIFFAALLLVPLLESGHNHADRDLAKPCTICVVAHHAPAASAPVLGIVAPITRTAVASVAPAAAPVSCDHSPKLGRAPPRSLSSAEV